MTRGARMASVIAAAVSLAALDGAAAEAQSLASRVAAVRDGMVRFSFASRPELCGHPNGISTGRNRGQTITWDSKRSQDVEWEIDCERGPVRVVLDRESGETAALRSYVGGKWRNIAARVTDLGTVPAREATDYLLSLAGSQSGKIAEKAIFPATLGEGTEVWPSLIRIARDEARPRNVRRQAIFWVSQAAGEAATAGLDNVVRDNSVDRDVREQAIFALSQRPKEEGVPALIRVARTNRDPELRKKAMFWLGQSSDPRALALFEEILGRR